MAWITPFLQQQNVKVQASDFDQYYYDLRYLKGLDGVPYIENAIELPELATPATPASGRGRYYVGTDSVPRAINDGGTVYQMINPAASLPVARSDAASVVFGLDATQYGSPITLANDGYTYLFQAGQVFGGAITIQEVSADGSIAQFLTGGGAIQKIGDPSSQWSAVLGNAGTSNVFVFNGSVGIQNKRGGTRTYAVFTIRTRTSN